VSGESFFIRDPYVGEMTDPLRPPAETFAGRGLRSGGRWREPCSSQPLRTGRAGLMFHHGICLEPTKGNEWAAMAEARLGDLGGFGAHADVR
jgi:hypothetical protein